MPIDKTAALADIDKVLATEIGHGGTDAVFQLAALQSAAIARWAPEGAVYRKQLDGMDVYKTDGGRNYMAVRAILRALRRDIEEDQVRTFEQLVHASVFDDLLMQATALVENGYRLPSAVVAGAALEEHVRLMAQKAGVPMDAPNKAGKMRPREASALREDLYAQKKVITAGERTQVQAWMDLRNEAAHNLPAFQSRTDGDVERMIEGVREFMTRHPA